MNVISTKKLYCLFISISLSISAWSQCNFAGLNANYCTNSPSAALTSTAPGGSFIGNGVIGSAFSPSLAGPGTHTISYAICASNYSVSAGTFSPYPVAGTSVTLGDDAVSGNLPIGFTFNFFCTNYTDFYISSNGFIGFSAGMPNGCCSGDFLPSFTTPDNLIATAWTDLYPPAGGSITYTTLGAAPNRKLVVAYNNIQHYNGANYGFPITSQIVLYETSNLIEIHTTSKPISANNAITTEGIQNSGASIGFAVAGRNAAGSWVATNDMYRFTPLPSCISSQTTLVSPAAINVLGSNSLCLGQTTTLTATGNTSYTWSTGSNSPSITASPAVTTNYTVSGTNSVGCVANSIITVSVFPGLPVLSIISSTSSVCLGKTVTLTANGAASYTWTGGISNGVGFTPTLTANYVVTGANACGSTTAVTTVTVAPLPLNVISTPTSICAGSPAVLNAVSPGTSYTWQPLALTGPSIAVNPQVTTIYTVSTSDGTCSGTATLSLLVKPIPTLAIVASSSLVCEGYPVFLSASGGNNYTWTPGNLSGTSVTVVPNGPTLYSVAATNSVGCVSGISQVVLTNASPTISILASSQLVCSGGSVNLTANGANTYTWLPNNINGPNLNDNPLSSIVYTVSGTGVSNTCIATNTIGVNVFQTNVSVASSPSVICSGSSSTLTAGGATSYQWNTNQQGSSIVVSPTSNTFYIVTATSSTPGLNCITVNSVQLTVNPKPTVTAVASRTVICKNEASTLTASGASTYSWSNNTSSISAKVTPSITTNYTVTGTDANGCVNTATLQVKVNQCTGIDESISNNSNGVNIYPNPSNGEFTVESDKGLSLTLVSELGQVIRSLKLSASNNYKVNISNLPNGIYFVVGESNAQNVYQKIIVNR